VRGFGLPGDHMSIAIRDAEISDLDGIIDLWKLHRRTLGFFPKGAFETHIGQRLLIVAMNAQAVVGYVCFRIARGRAALVHLCVSESLRGGGIGRKLFDAVKVRLRPLKLEGIVVKCRSDYDENKMWPHLGFSPVTTESGRGQDGTRLTRWWHQLHHGNNIFSSADEDRLIAVMDANILYDTRRGNDETDGLLQGWIESEIRLFITEEMFNELHRAREQKAEKVRTASDSWDFPTLPVDDQLRDDVRAQLKVILAPGSRDSDQSDFRHVLNAIAGKADFFITRDEAILSAAGAIQAGFNVRVVRPSTLISDLDQLLHPSAYQRGRLAGSGYTCRKMSDISEDDLWACFGMTGQGEKKTDFLTRVRVVRSHPDTSEALLIDDLASRPNAVILTDHRIPLVTDVSMLRVCTGLLARTVQRHLLSEAVSKAVKRKTPFIRFSDPCVNDDARQSLIEQGFVSSGDSWCRIAFRGLVDAVELRRRLTSVPDDFKSVAKALNGVLSTTDQAEMIKIERTIWPCKMTNVDVPTYLIPIKPGWACHLFDSALAEQDLYPAIERLALSCENVFYSGAKLIMAAPARILWYVSGSAKYRGSKSIRACSYLDEITVGSAKQVFKKYEDLGVYQWRDIKTMTNGDIAAPIKALKFSGTELLDRPISFNDLQLALVEGGRPRNPVAGPVRIGWQLFETLYRNALNGV